MLIYWISKGSTSDGSKKRLALEGKILQKNTMCRLLSLCLTILFVFSGALVAQEYPVSGFTLSYGNPRPGLPDLGDLRSLEIKLDRSGDTWTAPSSENSPTVRLGSVPGGAKFDGAGLNAVMTQIVKYYNDQGIMAVYVVPAEGQINPRSGRDLRRDETGLSLNIWIGRIAETRTVARGERFLKSDTINLPQHKRILDKAPINKADENGDQPSVLVLGPVNEYLERLNRHPGRRVDLAVSAAEQPGDLIVDLLVNEQKPWYVYGQLSNTGPESTGEWRARAGFIHYQITNSDDILSVDVLSDFKDTLGATMGYSRPFVYPDILIFRFNGSYIDYTAAELAEGTIDYLGTTYTAGLELAYRPFYWKKFSFEFFGGVKYQDFSVTSQTTEENFVVTDGAGDLLLPYVGVSIARREQTHGYSAMIQYEMNTSSVDEENRSQLGRVNVDEDFSILSASFKGTWFLEPIFKRKRWGNPENWKDSTLAHEVRVSISGQYGFSKRLFAQSELVLGGMDRVRGYPESSRAGDSGFMASFEYAYHIPRALKPETVIQREAAQAGQQPVDIQPFLGRFKTRPPDIFALPDWDFVVKAFFDIGSTTVNEAGFNESDADLMSVGIGFELQLASTAAIRVDWGTVLEALERGGEIDVDSGSNRIHVRAQVTW